LTTLAAGGVKAPASLYIPVTCTIAAVTELTPHEKLFRIELPGGADLGHRPGQFVQISLLGQTEAPISVASSPTRSGCFELGVRRAGRLTGALHALRAGDEVGIRGPFGRPFDLASMAGKDLVLVSGGCGLAPMRSLVQYVEDRPEEFARVTLIYGAKNPQAILFKEDVRRWESSARFACLTTVDDAEDGECWEGNVGLVTRLIPLLQIDPEKSVAVIVGPPAMYRFVIEELIRKGVAPERIALSLERTMRCGVGKCGHCTIEHLYCCTDGPVFWLPEVSAIAGAL
jgi:sulfhydrogenase subunit gamma (sulfur reductase)